MNQNPTHLTISPPLPTAHLSDQTFRLPVLVLACDVLTGLRPSHKDLVPVLCILAKVYVQSPAPPESRLPHDVTALRGGSGSRGNKHVCRGRERLPTPPPVTCREYLIINSSKLTCHVGYHSQLFFLKSEEDFLEVMRVCGKKMSYSTS